MRGEEVMDGEGRGLVRGESLGLVNEGIELVKKTVGYERASLAANTRRTYGVFWSKFERWCEENGLCSLPASAETVSLYLGSLGGLVSFSTIDGVIAAIEKTHEERGVSILGNVALYRRVRKGIRREHKERQCLKSARALTVEDLVGFCGGVGGFFGGFEG